MSLSRLIFRFFILFIAITAYGYSTPPPRYIPRDLYDEFTMGGQIPVFFIYRDDTYSSSQPIIYSYQTVEDYKARVLKRECYYYGNTDYYLYEAIENTIGNFEGKTVGIIGSVLPWYEAIVLAYNGKPVSIDYNKIVSRHPDITTMTVDEYDQNPIKFDYIFSISSFEHDGLGRYGDPLNPTGDFEAMNKAKKMLKDGGYLFLAVPIGPDWLVWNEQRVYGPIRFPQLIKGWDMVNSVGFQPSDFRIYSKQPIFVLNPRKERN